MAKKTSEVENKITVISEEEQPYELPEGWIWTRLGDIAKTQYGYTESATTENIGPKFLRITDIQNGQVDWEKVPYCKISENDFLKYKLHAGNIVVARTGATTGKSYIICDNVDAVYASYLIGVSLNNDFADDRFVYNYMQSIYYWMQITSFSQGIAQPGVNGKKLQEVLLPLPPKEKQQKIVDIIESLFAKLDIAKEKVQAVLDGSELRRSAILHKAFNGELTEKWREENNVSFDTWKERSLQDVCSMKITDGTHKTPTYCDKAEGIPFISSKDVVGEKICWNNVKYITKELHEELYRRLSPQKNDVLLAKNGTTGVAAIVEDDRVFDIYVTLAVLRPEMDIIIPDFLLKVVNSPICKQQFNANLTGIGVPNLHLRDIKIVTIPLPTIPEQQEIVCLLDKFLSAEDTVKTTCQNTLATINTMKQSILAKAFRGELQLN